jgi:dephospho-CoA kinase
VFLVDVVDQGVFRDIGNRRGRDGGRYIHAPSILRPMAKLRVGLTGGIGSGKSAVAAAFAKRGATVIDADILARQVVAPRSDGLREIAALWPQAIRPDGALDRPAMAQIVFSDETARARLNAITHPRVRALAAAIEAAAPDGLIVHVIPLLFEGDAWRGFEKTVLVFAPFEARIARVIARDGTDRAAVERRMAAQIDPELARSRADYVIENDGDLEALRERSNRCYDALLRDLEAKEDPA